MYVTPISYILLIILIIPPLHEQKSCGNLEVLANQYTDITNYLSLILNLFKKRYNSANITLLLLFLLICSAPLFKSKIDKIKRVKPEINHTPLSLSEESMSMSCSLQMEECNTVICDSVQPLVLALQNSAVSLSHVSNVGM